MPLLRDGDAVFVDYLRALGNDDVKLLMDFLDMHAKLTEDGLQKFDGIAGLEDKYRWLATYHNHCVERDKHVLGDETSALMVACSRPLGEFSEP